MTPLEQAIDCCRGAIAKHRRILTVLHSTRMKEVCENFTAQEWSALNSAVFNGDSNAIRRLLRNHVVKDALVSMTTLELREIAKSYQIPHYYRMYKEELLQEIAYVRRVRTQNGVVCEDSETASGNAGTDVTSRS